MRCARGHSSGKVQKALLAHVRALLPENARVIVAGDSEFGAVEVMRQLNEWQWQYVLRQKSSHLVQLLGKERQAFGDLVQKGQCLWLGEGLLTAQHAFRVNLLAQWKPGEQDPWLLATNLDNLHAALKAYSRRMWIEEMFGDFKGHGFDLESSHLRDFIKLSRLTFAVALLYVWLIAFGSQVANSGKRYLVDRSDRGDLSIFQVGLRMIARLLKNEQTITFTLAVHFPDLKLSGG